MEEQGWWDDFCKQIKRQAQEELGKEYYVQSSIKLAPEVALKLISELEETREALAALTGNSPSAQKV